MEPKSGGSPRARSTSGGGQSLGALLLQFIVATVVVAALAAGPRIFGASGKLRDSLQRYLTHDATPVGPALPAQVSPPVKAPPKSPVPRVVATPRAPVPDAVPARVVVPLAAPVTATPAPRPATPQSTPRPPRTSPARPRVESAKPARPSPTPVVLVTPATPATTGLSPQQYYDSLMRQGFQLYQTGWYGPAMGRFKQAALVMPSSPSPLLWQARAALKIKRYDVARDALERVITVAPGSDAAREARAMLEWFK